MPGGEPFDWAIEHLLSQWNGRIRSAAMVPFAGVSLSWDEYAAWVGNALAPHGIEITSVHLDPTSVESADAIFVGGGNTFHLTYHLHETGLMSRIREQVRNGKPYMGWSAGANVAAPTLRTTNDMPIIEPASFQTLGCVPFQINPHYSSIVPLGHQGETRDQRLHEFVTANPTEKVIGLPEGAMIKARDGVYSAWGQGPLRIFTADNPTGLGTPIESFAG